MLEEVGHTPWQYGWSQPIPPRLPRHPHHPEYQVPCPYGWMQVPRSADTRAPASGHDFVIVLAAPAGPAGCLWPHLAPPRRSCVPAGTASGGALPTSPAEGELPPPMAVPGQAHLWSRFGAPKSPVCHRRQYCTIFRQTQPKMRKIKTVLVLGTGLGEAPAKPNQSARGMCTQGTPAGGKSPARPEVVELPF